MLNKKKNNKGFTLVELLVVIAIIGILAVVAVPALFRNIEKAKVGDLEADINAVRSASLSYFADNNEYPNGELIKSDGTIDTSLLNGELENLSNPFDASTYALDGQTPKDLELTITFSGKAKLSQNAVTNLQKSIAGLGTVAKDGSSVKVTILKADGTTTSK